MLLNKKKSEKDVVCYCGVHYLEIIPCNLPSVECFMAGIWTESIGLDRHVCSELHTAGALRKLNFLCILIVKL